MANVKVRHFVEKPGRDAPRYFWQPSAALRALGWRPERLPDERAAALARAEQLNAELDAWREGRPPPAVTGAPVRRPAGTVQAGTLSEVIRCYRASRYYPTNAKTRKSYEDNIRVVEAWAGDAPIAAITPKRIDTLYTSLYAKTPSKAHAVIVMLRMLLKHAVREEIVPSHPYLDVDPGLQAPAFSGRLWPLDAVSLMVEVADRMGWHSVGTAIAVNYWLGQREGDILAMQRGAYRDGVFHITQSKTGARVAVPHSPWVQRRVDAELSQQKARKVEATAEAPLLFCETTGRRWKEFHFRKVIAKIRDQAAAEWRTFFLPDGTSVDTLDLQYMHMRHTAVTELAIAGCTTLQIAGITGHTPKSVEQILSRYLVRTSDLAASATTLRLAAGGDIAALGDEVGRDDHTYF